MDYAKGFLAALIGLCAVTPAVADAQTSGLPACEVHYWPAQHTGAAVDALVGPGLLDELLGAGKPLPETAERMRKILSPEAQLAFLDQVDFSGLLGGASPTFYLESGGPDAFSLKKSSPALLSPRADCYVEVIVGGLSLNVHKLYGATVSLAAVVRVYGRDSMPKVAILTGGGTKIDKGARKVARSTDDLTADIQRSFIADLREIVGQVAKRISKSS